MIDKKHIRPSPGQPRLPYKTKTVRIPVDLEEQVKRLVNDYKQKQGA